MRKDRWLQDNDDITDYIPGIAGMSAYRGSRELEARHQDRAGDPVPGESSQ